MYNHSAIEKEQFKEIIENMSERKWKKKNVAHIWTHTFKNTERERKRKKKSHWSCPHRGLSDKNNMGEWLCHRGPQTLKLHLSQRRRLQKCWKSGSHFIGRSEKSGSGAGRLNKSAVKGSLHLNNPIKNHKRSTPGWGHGDNSGWCQCRLFEALQQNIQFQINVRSPLNLSITHRYAHLHICSIYTHPHAWPVSFSKIFFFRGKTN